LGLGPPKGFPLSNPIESGTPLLFELQSSQLSPFISQIRIFNDALSEKMISSTNIGSQNEFYNWGESFKVSQDTFLWPSGNYQLKTFLLKDPDQIFEKIVTVNENGTIKSVEKK
jgi:hypothetical protein